MDTELAHVRKVFFEGTHRAVTPMETEKAARSLMESAGVDKIQDITRNDRLGIPCFLARRRSAPHRGSSVLPGMGRTRLLARVSAMMAAIERHFGKYHGGHMECTSYEEATVRGAIDPRSLILPQPLLPGEQIHWSRGTDLYTGEDILVPGNAVYYPYDSRGIAIQLFQSDPVGLASGNVREEAILHGLLEVLELDALSRAERQRDMGRRIAVDTPGPVQDLLKKFENAGVEIHLWLIGGRTRVPVVAAAADDTGARDPGLLIMGSACHPDPGIAVERALFDVAFSRASYLGGELSSPQRDMLLARAGYERMKRINREWFAPAKEVALSSIPCCSTPWIDEDIGLILDDLHRTTDHACIVDLKPAPLPVVRVVVPGLEVSHLHKDRRSGG